MSWDYFVSQGISLFVEDRIDKASARRQHVTAAKILERLSEQPGLVLADEVGMGKTFVALAVGVSVALENPDAGPVVVMVPSSVKTKWPRDFSVFRSRCLKDRARDLVREVGTTVEHGVDFLKLLDDPPERRKQIVFMTHGALSAGLTDPWVKLALLKHVFGRRRRTTQVRDAFVRFAPALLQLRTKHVDDELIEQLLKKPPNEWRSIIERAGVPMDDDPVPEALVSAIDSIDAQAIDVLADALAEMPLRSSATVEERITHVRQLLAAAFREVWTSWLAAACRRQRLPLLILDEAHHLKNPSTRLASLFHEGEEDVGAIAGPLAGVFERMLFLTATPFQLGHAELLRVIERFGNVAWGSEHAPRRTKEVFEADFRSLKDALDQAHIAALGLERAWRRLRTEHVVDEQGAPAQVDAWWHRVSSSEVAAHEGLVGDVVARFRHTESAMREAERQLQPWVIRHLKDKHLPDADIERRRVLPGAAIVDEVGVGAGLEIGERSLLPFLLAARAQASLAHSGAGRALFAEGLASSFEAYRDTRANSDQRDEDVSDESKDAEVPAHVRFYLDRIEQALPREKDDATAAHPKVAATVNKVLELFKSGEKALVFCFYRATGRAIERHVSRAMDDALNALAAARFGIPVEDAPERLQRLGERFNRLDDALRREADERLASLVCGVGGLGAAEEELVVSVMRRFLRTPAFLARYFPNGRVDAPIDRALRVPDASGLELSRRFEDFCRFLSVRCTAEERSEYLTALQATQTGERYARDDDEDHPDAGGRLRLLPTVRLVNGSTKDETRRRLLLCFNTPFFPEVLVASSVLAEGVDLHLSCRYVIHHDLCWNPSTLEQRTGRVDRLGAKAEKAKAPIHVYLPYVAATQDEKMYRVVTERERWFQVIMGEKFDIDEQSTDLASRALPPPAAFSSSIALKLGLS